MRYKYKKSKQSEEVGGGDIMEWIDGEGGGRVSDWFSMTVEYHVMGGECEWNFFWINFFLPILFMPEKMPAMLSKFFDKLFTPSL